MGVAVAVYLEVDGRRWEEGKWRERGTHVRVLYEPNKFTCAKELVIIIDTCKRLG